MLSITSIVNQQVNSHFGRVVPHFTSRRGCYKSDIWFKEHVYYHDDSSILFVFIPLDGMEPFTLTRDELLNYIPSDDLALFINVK